MCDACVHSSCRRLWVWLASWAGVKTLSGSYKAKGFLLGTSQVRLSQEFQQLFIGLRFGWGGKQQLQGRWSLLAIQNQHGPV